MLPTQALHNNSEEQKKNIDSEFFTNSCAVPSKQVVTTQNIAAKTET